MKIYLIVIIALLTNKILAQNPVADYQLVAAENHPGLKTTYSEYLAALERVPQSGVLPDPQVSFGYFISPVETRVGPQKMKFSLSQMFPWFGTLSKEKSIATELAKARFEAFENEKRSLNLEVTKQYYGLVNLHMMGQLMEENRTLFETLKTLATQRFENNKGTLVDVIKIGIEINALENSISLNNDLLQTSKHNFNLTIGRAADEEIVIFQDSAISSTMVESGNSIDQHPMLKSLNYQISAYDERIELVKLQAKPRLGFGLDYVVVGQRSDIDIPDNGQNAFMPMINMSLPIFGKKYKAASNEAEHMRQVRQNEYDARELSLVTNYEKQSYQLNKARKDLQLYEKQIVETQDGINLLLTAYTSEQANFEDLIEMQEQQLNFQKAWQNAFRDLMVSYAEITYLTGNEY